MYAHVCVHIYVCMYVCIYISAYTYVYNIYTYIQIITQIGFGLYGDFKRLLSSFPSSKYYEFSAVENVYDLSNVGFCKVNIYVYMNLTTYMCVCVYMCLSIYQYMYMYIHLCWKYIWFIKCGLLQGEYICIYEFD
jgi:hypothetical protein